jgi:hypothetical protein
VNEPIASFHEMQKITKMSFNIPIRNVAMLLIYFIFIQSSLTVKKIYSKLFYIELSNLNVSFDAYVMFLGSNVSL